MERQCLRHVSKFFLALGVTLLFSASAMAEECSNRGNLDVQYCDEDGDLVADTPKNTSE